MGDTRSAPDIRSGGGGPDTNLAAISTIVQQAAWRCRPQVPVAPSLGPPPPPSIRLHDDLGFTPLHLAKLTYVIETLFGLEEGTEVNLCTVGGLCHSVARLVAAGAGSLPNAERRARVLIGIGYDGTSEVGGPYWFGMCSRNWAPDGSATVATRP